MSNAGKKNKIFYGWLIVAGCFIIMGMSLSLIHIYEPGKNKDAGAGSRRKKQEL